MASTVKKTRLISAVQKQIATLQLYESRVKFAMTCPSSFLPEALFSKFRDLDSSAYTAITDWEPVSLTGSATIESINHMIDQLSQLLMHAVIVNQNGCWVFVSQVEIYYKDKAVDDVAFITKHDKYVDELVIKMDMQVNEGGGSWHELRLTFGRFEVIATGGFSGVGISNNCKITPFLGVGVPPSLASDEKLILFSSSSAVPSLCSERMLHDYQRKHSLNKWCRKSSLFTEKMFCTPEPLKLHHSSDDFVYLASKLICSTSKMVMSVELADQLKAYLNTTQYWKDLGLNDLPTQQQILTKVAEVRAKKHRARLSQSKCVLVELLLSYEEEYALKKSDLTLVFNGILYPRIKNINKERVKRMTKFLQD